MFSNILGGAAGFPVADLGDEISQSVRFRGGQSLTNTSIGTASTSTPFTISLWVKITNPSDHSTYIWRGDTGINSTGASSFLTSGSTGEGVITVNMATGGNGFVPPMRFRDTAGWYHIVMAHNGSADLGFWVNGVQLTANDNTVNSGGTITSTGARLDDITIGSSFNGYLADIRFVDGQSLDEEDFGRYQEDGVWVPKNYTGTYGTNGFHLDFADGSNPGNDVSGNNNDFTATGFDTADVALYSKDLFTSTSSSINVNSTSTGFDSVSFPPSNAFDGSTSTQCTTNSATDTAIIFRPSTAITNVTQIEVTAHPTTAITDLVGGFNGTGNEANITSTGYQEIYNGSAITLNNLYVRTTNGQAALCAIRINGSTVLIDNTDNDVDFLDTPTSNYATWNPLLPTNGTLSNANLQRTGTTSGYALKPSTIGLDTNGNYYFEYLPTANDISQVGITNENQNFDNQTQMVTAGIGLANSSGGTSSIIQNGTATQTGLTAFDDGDIVGVQLDGATVRFFINGTQVGTDETVVPGDYVAAVSDNSGGTSSDGSINFGQQPFLYQPAGTVALQTNNLPEPTIKNGRDHFDVLTWTGNATADRAITGLEFQPALVWIKNRAATNLDYIVADGIMGSNRRLRSNTSDAFGSTTDFRTFTSDGFTLGDQSITNGGSSPNTYVAWCWNAPSDNSSNTDGDITTSIRANVTGGFSIIQFIGNQNEDTIGHGLNAEPEFAIAKCLGVGNTAWQIYHHTLGVDSFLNFTTGAMTNTANFWGTADEWNANTCGLGAGNVDHNRNDELMRWYVWHGVEGYSHFGSYTGNGNAAGSFIYTGFTPRMILIRAAQTGTNGQEPWFAYDTAREPNNVMNQPLEWNSQNAEGATSRDIDILSNGFKCRSAANQVNGSGTNYIYAAWAENPFGGENAPPATAR